jgi:Zn-dependent protease with chaperone function
VTVAAVLLAYALGTGTLGARTLARAGWTARAPLLAILTYLAAAWSVVAALALAGLTLAVHATALGGALSQLIGACALRLRDTYTTPGGPAVAGTGLVLTAAVAVRTALTAASHLRVTWRQALRHARTARLVGRPEPVLGAVLLEHSQPAAYCVAGRHPTVVLTTGALQALTPGQLEAVLAHERAHLAWHHHRLLAMARISRRALPFLPLMRDTEAQVQRLVELHADDAATQVRDPGSLATALVVLATAASAPASAAAGDPVPVLAAAGDPVPVLAAAGDPVPVLAAAGDPVPVLAAAAGQVPVLAAVAGPAPVLASAVTDTAQRIHRLLRPAEPLGRLRRLLLRAMAAGLVLGPLVMALAPAVLALALGRVPHP